MGLRSIAPLDPRIENLESIIYANWRGSNMPRKPGQ